MNHTCAFPAEAGTHLPTPEGWKAELALGGWLVTYWNKCPAPGIKPNWSIDQLIGLSIDISIWLGFSGYGKGPG